MARTTAQEKARKTAEIQALLEAHELGVQAIAAKVGCSTRLVMSIKNGNGNTGQNGNGNGSITITGSNTVGTETRVSGHPGPAELEPTFIDAPLNMFEGHEVSAMARGEDEVAGMNVKAWMALGAAKVELERVAALKMYRNRPQLAGLKAAIELINEATN